MKSAFDFFLLIIIKAMGAFRDAKGQTLVEYALIIMLIALVVIIALMATGQTLNDTYYSKIPEAFPK